MQDHDQALLEILDYYAAREDRAQQEILVSMLREIQELLGCVPDGVQQQAARAVGVKPSMLACIVKRYPSLKSASYRHRITACTGARCGARQSAALLALLRRELQPDAEGLSADGTILLRTQNCLKQCRTAPNLLVDGVLMPCASPDDVLRLLSRLRE